MTSPLTISHMPREATEYFLRIAFMDEPVQKDLYIGVALKASGDPTLASLSKAEPKGDGYRRVKLGPKDWRLNDGTVESAPASFTNTGQGFWGGVDVAFLATGSGAQGVLLAWAYLQTKRALFSSDQLTFPFRIRFL